MKFIKQFYIIVFNFVTIINVNGQLDCPVFNSVSFTKQNQIDSFAIKYPNCKQLNDLSIRGNDITNLDKFPKEIEIIGYIEIKNCPILEQFTYDLNFNYLNSSIIVDNNAKLKTIGGLKNIKKAGNIFIRNNPELIDSIFFPNILQCGNIDINDNDKLQKISGFDSLETAKSIEIYRNGDLKEIQGFNNAKQIKELKVYRNDSLSKFNGFNNYGDYCEVVHFDSRELAFFSGFQNLKKAKTILFSNVNLEKIESFYDVEESSVLLLHCEELTDLYNFKKIKRAFNITVSECNTLKDLSGFDSIKVIFNQLYIDNNRNLVSINSFNQLDSIYDSCVLESNGFVNMMAFDNLKYIGSGLDIGSNFNCTSFEAFNNLMEIKGNTYLQIVNNNSLKKLGAFNQLIFVDSIYISSNSLLENITEFNHLNTDYLKKVEIIKNINLSVCNTNPICQYMEDSLKNAVVFGNASGCATREEIIISCQVNTIEEEGEDVLVLYPNPVSDKLNIKVKFDRGELMDVNGKTISSFLISDVDCQALSPGIYFVRLFQNESFNTFRFVKI